MNEKVSSTNKITIGKNSSDNIVLQNTTVDNMFLFGGNSDLIQTMGSMGRYDLIQEFIKNSLQVASSTHPLQPYFSAKYNGELEKLVSTPETEDAFQQFPKKIKSTILIDYKKYPHMDKSETPWEYAYRTQTKVELKTTAYQEYLGDSVDPFPTVEYSDGMTTIINPPEFPTAVDATIQSGNISIPIRLRRKPCFEFGKMMFGTDSDDGGFALTFTTFTDSDKVDFKLTKTLNYNLSTNLRREKLIKEMKDTRKFKILIGNSTLMEGTLKENELRAAMFESAPIMISFLENLIVIETHLGCKFNAIGTDVYTDDYRTAAILAASLEDTWYSRKMKFDDEVRCDYDNIPDGINDDANSSEDKIIDGIVLSISLLGQKFSADKYTIVYKNARINNLSSIIKNKQKKRKNIMFTFKPINGQEHFIKYCKFEGIKLL